MYMTMNYQSLKIAAQQQDPGSLAYELAGAAEAEIEEQIEVLWAERTAEAESYEETIAGLEFENDELARIRDELEERCVAYRDEIERLEIVELNAMMGDYA